MAGSPVMTDVFSIMELRAPFTPGAKSLRQNYIRDDFIGTKNNKPLRMDTDLQTNSSPSQIGQIVFKDVFNCVPRNTQDPEANNGYLANYVYEALLPRYRAFCPNEDPTEDLNDGIRPLSIFDMERRAYIKTEDWYYLLPEKLEQIEGLPLFPEISRLYDVMEKAYTSTDLDLPKLVHDLEAVLGGRKLSQVVFNNGVYSNEYREAKRKLFDTLYILYVLRRLVSVNLEYAIEGLRVLHVLEALAVDELISKISIGCASILLPILRLFPKLFTGGGLSHVGPAGKLSAFERALLALFFSQLNDQNTLEGMGASRLIQNKADYDAYFNATPVVHPIFAKLHWYTKPFNNIRPIGVGDLKVVKQWLVAYLPGEISYIENVLKGEIRDRVHRRLEKTEEIFSYASETTNEALKDSQTADRFELKREAESVIKTETNISANASVTGSYSGPNYSIVGNVGANFSYKKNTSDQVKTCGTVARETLTKAVDRVQKKTMEQRQVTKLFETEETNKHGFDNVRGSEHISGIYRWVDKKYKAQLFNYGKRLMFEFVIPEPAAFWVESRLNHFTSSIDFPKKPGDPPYKENPVAALSPTDITPEKFNELKLLYDLSEFTYPIERKRVEFVNQETGCNFFSEVVNHNDRWYAKAYSCQINSKDYCIEYLEVSGFLDFFSAKEDNNDLALEKQNTLIITIGGTEYRWINNGLASWAWTDTRICPNIDTYQNLPFTSDTVSVTIGSWDNNTYDISIAALLKLSPDAKEQWQWQVVNKVKAIEQEKVDKINQELEIEYNSEMATYRNRLDELKAQTVQELLQGQSEAFNRELIRTELKKHCLTMLSKEFDSDQADDLLSKINPVTQGTGKDFYYHKFHVDENEATCNFSIDTGTATYPSIHLQAAKFKGRYIQFLEQAFDWQQLAYLFYPYYWATRPKWIEMMNRKDDTDPNMTAFLRAGSVRVLLAVTPAYDSAVLHFLATRQPWEGGPSPVIGDPLFIPLYEELRKQQDDLYNAVPEGEPWTFVLPTSLVYLQDSSSSLPEFPDTPNRSS